MDWSFTSAKGKRETDDDWPVAEHHANYLNYGGSSFQLVPTERTSDRTNWWGTAPNYRGHTFQLWDEGVPTPYALHYRHDAPSNMFTGMRGDSLYLTPPAHAPNPMFTRLYPTGSFPPKYGTGQFDAGTSRGKSPYQMYDRDMHHYTISRIDHPMMDWDADRDAPYINRYSYIRDDLDRTNQKDIERVREYVHHNLNKFPNMLQGSSPAPDPVQREAMPPDTTPRSRQISRGETKIAARIESKATAKDEL